MKFKLHLHYNHVLNIVNKAKFPSTWLAEGNQKTK